MAKNDITSQLKKLPDNLMLEQLNKHKSDLSRLEQLLMERLKSSNDTLIDTQIALDDVTDRFDLLSDQLSDEL